MGILHTNKKIVHDRGIIIALLASFGVCSMGLLLTPAIYNLSVFYTGISYGNVSMLATIPSLMSMGVSFLLSTKLQEKIRHKWALAFGLLLFLLGGLFPFFTESFALAVVARFVFGLGYGIIYNQTNIIMIKLFSGKKLDWLLSMGSIMTNVICMLSIIVGGFISDINIRMIWLLHAIAAFPLIMVLLYLPEPETDPSSEPGKTGTSIKRNSTRIPLYIYLISLGFGLSYMVSKTVMLCIPSVIINEGIGTAAITGVLLALNRSGGLVGGAIYIPMHRILKEYTIPCWLAVQLAAVFTCWLTSSLFLMGFTIFLMGASQFVIQPTIIASIARTEPHIADRSASYMFAFTNLGGFFPSVYISYTTKIVGHEDMRTVLFSLIFIVGIIMILWIIRACRLHAKHKHDASKCKS